MYVDYYTGVMMEMKKMMMRDCDQGKVQNKKKN